jgi:NADPH-dependent 2,4-dienoyl-CoA reductase/sulfur reductase-like enzyme
VSRALEFDVVVIGAGPAGIAAACAAAEAGKRVAIVDDNEAPGGQIWRAAGARRDTAATSWLARLERSGARLLSRTRVFDAPERGVLAAETEDTARLDFGYRKLVVATGARERFLPFPGWTLPGVMGAGGLQSLAKGGLPVEGKRVVLAGSGPLLLAVAAYLRKQGAVVPLIAEQAALGQLLRFGAGLARHAGKLLQALQLKGALKGTRFRSGCWPVAAHGDNCVRVVILTDGASEWQQDCDYLACGFGLAPNVELPLLLGCSVAEGFVLTDEWQQTSIGDVYCCGEPTGIGGVDLALVEGEIAGHACADQHERARALFTARDSAREFQRLLDSAFRLRPELARAVANDTIVCRCEDVTYGDIATHGSWRSAKLQTRCGMGPCQGRICGPAVEYLLGWKPESVRPPILPVSLRTLAGTPDPPGGSTARGAY